MSTKSDRAWRANRHIIPIKIDVRQKDGSYITQILDADVRVSIDEYRECVVNALADRIARSREVAS